MQLYQFTYVGQKLTQVDEWYDVVTETQTLGYDTQLRMNSVTNPRGAVGYVFDSGDRTTSYTVDGAATPTASYVYYPDGSVKTITWVPTAPTPSYVFTYLYDRAGHPTKLTFPPQGQHRDYAYDEQGRLLSLATKTSTNTNLATYAYGYDLNHKTGTTYDRKGQRVSLTATVPSMSSFDGLRKYEYDTLYELTKETTPLGQTGGWGYDAVGNRINDFAGATYTYNKFNGNPNNSQQLKDDGGHGHTWTYEGRGNTATQTGPPSQNFTYTWDWRNQLASIANSATASYAYDSQGRRSSKTVSGTKTSCLYDGLNLVREKTGTQLMLAADYVFGPGIDQPLAMKRAGVVYYYIVDGLGSVRLVTDTANAVKNTYQWSPWGERQGTVSDLVTSPFGYTAREIGDAKDHFYRARYYNPGIGRFLSEDPVRFSGRDINFYRYASNRPLILKDPLGLYGTSDCSYYRTMCREVGGKYYCTTAQYWCDLFPKPPDPDPNRDDDWEGWFRCTRKCLQDCDVERRQKECLHLSPGQNPVPPTFADETPCHTRCYIACAGPLAGGGPIMVPF